MGGEKDSHLNGTFAESTARREREIREKESIKEKR